MLVLRITGKARQVFKLIELLVRTRGNKTLGELIQKGFRDA